MNRTGYLIFVATMLLAACAPARQQGTIAELRNRQIDIENEQLEGGLEKAMRSYQQFLAETPNSALAPEALRRLADLKVEKEYGLLTSGEVPEKSASLPTLPAHQPATVGEVAANPAPAVLAAADEPEADFEQRATDGTPIDALAGRSPEDSAGPIDLERAGPREAIALYRQLLEKYPLYERNDQVLYQMSRAYEELGRVEDAMEVMNRLVREYPRSRYIDEVQFRRAEFFFTRRQFLDAEEAYGAIVAIGEGSAFYPFALYKLGWTFYKQEFYDEALHRFMALLDYQVAVGYDFAQTADEAERKRMDDTFRVVSLSFSYLGGAEVVAEYFDRYGARSYEDLVYSSLGEYYFDKRRYSDANAAYTAFVDRHPFHEKAPHFQMRIIEINIAGGFPTLVIEAKQRFADRYGLQAAYWHHFDPEQRPEVLDFLKTNLTDLANHYHALYQAPEFEEEKTGHFEQALQWYRKYLASFPADPESPAINYQMADLLLENRTFAQAAVEYERTAYDYPEHEKAATAGYAAVYAYRQHLEQVREADRVPVTREVVRSSLQFAEKFPEHEKAAVVLGAAVDDLFDMQAYEQAVAAGEQLVTGFPAAAAEVRQSAWLVIGHASYELSRYPEAEVAYLQLLELLPEHDDRRPGLVDNLAAAVYQQGAAATAAEDHRTAASHFLRVGQVAPGSTIMATAEFDGAAALILLEDWSGAAEVLTRFRSRFPDHELQSDVTKKLAYVYRENGRLSLAAREFERIETESANPEVRSEALLTAAELYEETGDRERTLQVYQRYVQAFAEPPELNLEIRQKIGEMLKEDHDMAGYLAQLEQIVALDAAAGESRTKRMRFLAAKAALVLAEQDYESFVAVQLSKPLEISLPRKQTLMKEAVGRFNRLLDYEIGEVTAAATYYLAEIYAHFSKALMASERPDDLTPLELEEYELAIEEQAYPFEEKAIAVHESNLELIALGIYNPWVEKSLARLARFMPARYDRQEAENRIIKSLATYAYEVGPLAPADRLPVPAAAQAPETVTRVGQGQSAADNQAEAAHADPGPSPAANDLPVSARGSKVGEASDADETAPAVVEAVR